MKSLIIFSILLTISVNVLSQTEAYSWEGEYYFKQTSDNPNHVWHYELKITKIESGYSADFKVWGHQTYKPMRCSVKTETNTVMFFFEDFTETPGTNNLKKGDWVLTLEYSDTSLYTKWSNLIRLWENFPADGNNKISKIN